MTRIQPLVLAAALLFALPHHAGADVREVAQRGYTPISIRTPPPKVVIERRRATGQTAHQQALEAQVNWGNPASAPNNLQPIAYIPAAIPPVQLTQPQGNAGQPTVRPGRGAPPPPSVFDQLRSLPPPLSRQSWSSTAPGAPATASINPLRPSGTYIAKTLVSSLNGPSFIRVQAPDVTTLGGDDFDPTALTRNQTATVDDLIDPPPSAFTQPDGSAQASGPDLFDSAPIVAAPAVDTELVPIPPRPQRTTGDQPDPAGQVTRSGLPNFSDLPIGVDSDPTDPTEPSRSVQYPSSVNVPASALATPPHQSLVTDHNITVAAGKNQIIEVARFHLNRFVTPIQNPVIRTTSSAQVDIQSDVIYVAAVDDQPIALYITDEGNEALAIVLTLIPRAIPPREVRLSFRGEDALAIGPSAPQARPEAQSWEQRQPYVNTIMGLLRSAAGGEVPPGYRLRRHTVKDPAVFCSDPFLQVEPVQIMEGHALSLTVSAVKNISQSDVTINELQCHLPGVAAVSAYPTPFLRPGQSAELYVVNRKYVASAAPRARPSVIDPDYLR